MTHDWFLGELQYLLAQIRRRRGTRAMFTIQLGALSKWHEDYSWQHMVVAMETDDAKN